MLKDDVPLPLHLSAYNSFQAWYRYVVHVRRSCLSDCVEGMTGNVLSALQDLELDFRGDAPEAVVLN